MNKADQAIAEADKAYKRLWRYRALLGKDKSLSARSVLKIATERLELTVSAHTWGHASQEHLNTDILAVNGMVAAINAACDMVAGED